MVQYSPEYSWASPRKIRSKSVKRLRRYGDLTVFKLVADAVLDFRKFKSLPAGTFERPNLRDFAKFHQDLSFRC